VSILPFALTTANGYNEDDGYETEPEANNNASYSPNTRTTSASTATVPLQKKNVANNNYCITLFAFFTTTY